MEVEASLANTNDFGMLRQCEQLLGRERGMIRGLVRMRTNGAPNPVIRLGDPKHSVELVEARANRQHRVDAGSAGAGDHRVALGREIGKVEMAMTVDQRRRPALSGHWAVS